MTQSLTVVALLGWELSEEVDCFNWVSDLLTLSRTRSWAGIGLVAYGRLSVSLEGNVGDGEDMDSCAHTRLLAYIVSRRLASVLG